MSLLDSLLDAIVRLDGDALVMHVGEKPFVITTSSEMNAFRGPLAWGQVELSSRSLTSDALLGMLAQMLPESELRALDELGAVEYELPCQTPTGSRFVAVAARGGADIWVEIRHARPKPPEPEVVAAPPPASSVPASHAVGGAVEPDSALGPSAELTRGHDAPATATPSSEPAGEPARPAIESGGAEQPPSVPPWMLVPEPIAEAPIGIEPVAVEPPLESTARAMEAPQPPEEYEIALDSALMAGTTLDVVRETDQSTPTHEEVEALIASTAAAPTARQKEETAGETAGPAPEPARTTEPTAAEPVTVASADEPRPAVVLPMTRSPIAAEQALPPERAGLDRYLRFAAARAASALFLVASSRPVLRVDGEITIVENEPPLSAAQVESLMMDLAPEPTREALRSGALTEWVCDVPEVGHVRCLSFRDHRGPGAVFRMLPARAISAEQLGLTPEIQALCAQADGLVLVTGPRGSGKSTLISAFVDLINRTRSDHLISIERQITFVHESRRSFVSQREVRGHADEFVAAARGALREDPDVLVLDEIPSADMAALALDAAASGRLVFGALPATSTTGAVERLLDQFAAERRPQIQTTLASALRAVVAQVLVRKVRGGRIAARELLLNTPAVAGLIAEGRTFQLTVALDSGRRQGMAPLNDSLAGFVRSGLVNPDEAYRKAADRAGLVALLQHHGVDTSFVERLA